MSRKRKQILLFSNSKPPQKIINVFDDLPADLLENIFSCLPAKDVIGLSILSKRFRYTWKICRNFSFDKFFAKDLSKDEYKNVLNNFFDNHSKSNIDKFQLYFDPTNDKDQVSHWVDEAIRLGAKEIELDFSPSSQSYFLSSYVIKSVTILKLVKCDLDITTTSNGLPNLRELTLQNVKPEIITLDLLFVNSSRLKKLELINCGLFYCVHISAYFLKEFKILVIKNCPNVRAIIVNAPKLTTFHFRGKHCEFVFYGILEHMDDVVLDIVPPRGFQLFRHKVNMMNNILVNVTVLTVTAIFLEGLCARFDDNEYKDMKFWLSKLKEFHLIVPGESFVKPFDVVQFLRKCPFVESVFIDLGLNSFQTSLYWEFHGRQFIKGCPYLFPYIKRVKIKGFIWNELPVAMARFFLRQAITLEWLVLVKAKNYVDSPIFTPSSIKSKITTDAEVEIHEYMGDKSDIIPTHLIDV